MRAKKEKMNDKIIIQFEFTTEHDEVINKEIILKLSVSKMDKK